MCTQSRKANFPVIGQGLRLAKASTQGQNSDPGVYAPGSRPSSVSNWLCDFRQDTLLHSVSVYPSAREH